MIFSTVPWEKTKIATIVVNQRAQYYHFQMLVCTDPVCLCGKVTVKFKQIVGDDDISSVPVAEHAISINLNAPQPAKPRRRTPPRFEDLFLKQLTLEDYRYLQLLYQNKKSHVSENAPLSTIEAKFDVKEIEDNITVCYEEILPFAQSFDIQLSGKYYRMEDSYCIYPGCKCTEVNFNFILVDTATAAGETMTIYLVDYRRPQAAWQEDTSCRVSGFIPLDIKAVQAAIETGYPQFYNLLQQRHQRLKLLYAFYRKRNNLPIQFNSSIYGRNDDCPCGSGQKYKKCCLPALS